MPSTTNRIIYHDKFDGNSFTNENSLANALLTRPDKINPVITHLAGREDKKFPLTFLTEGQKGGVKPIEINDIQYEWDTFRRIRRSDAIISTPYSGSDKPGLNNTPAIVVFETNWLKVQHLVVSPNGIVCRIMSRPVATGNNYQYRVRLTNPDPQAYIPLAELAVGMRWTMEGGAPVSESYSMGNESNRVTPGKMKNQISILRKSYEWGGNTANKTVEVRFNVEGAESNLWMPFERWQHTMDWKQVVEEHIWRSEYNRDVQGIVRLLDEDSQLPVPIGAGVVDQIPNVDTYSVLTAQKIKNTVGDVMYGATDTGAMDVVLYTGLGGADEFDSAMKSALGAIGFSIIPQAGQFITGAGRHLMLGGFFTQYQHIDGHMITVKLLPLLDHGARAENSPRHPKSGKPLSSYEMFFLDQSTYDGINNVRMVTQKGRSMITGVLKGMSPTPMDFAGNGTELIATEQDKCSVHFLSAKGVNINRNTHCFRLKCEIV